MRSMLLSKEKVPGTGNTAVVSQSTGWER